MVHVLSTIKLIHGAWYGRMAHVWCNVTHGMITLAGNFLSCGVVLINDRAINMVAKCAFVHTYGIPT